MATQYRSDTTSTYAAAAVEPEASAVSWAAVLAGAAAAAALSLILVVLGTGLGLSSVSPWANEGANAKALGISTAVWVAFMAVASSALGGYIAGRLRTRWASLHTDEVAFRDTAHGFLAWALATLFTAWLLSHAASMVVGGGVKAGADVAGGAAAESKQGGESYFVDSLFRSPKGAKAMATQDGVLRKDFDGGLPSG